MRIKFSLAAVILAAAIITVSVFSPTHRSGVAYAADKKAIPVQASEAAGAAQNTHTHTPNENQVDAVQAAEERRNAITRLSPEVRSELAKMLNTSSKGLVATTKNGVTSMHLQGRFQSVPVATIDENGKAHVTDYFHMNPSQNQ